MGTVGLGGYALFACDTLLNESDRDGAVVQLTAVCEPDHRKYAEKIADLRGRGIKVFTKYEELLSEPIDGLWLPLPIDLHRPFAEKGFAAGKAVLCEKPAAGCVDDAAAMIAARDRARKPGIIGFQRVYEPVTTEVKKRLVRGDIGAIQSATLMCRWPRGSDYYQRSDWAGKFQRNGVWVMDSPANNAMAHYIHMAMFLLGSSVSESGQPASVEAELYRANPIENFDTCSMRLHLAGGTPLLVLLTHACSINIRPWIHIQGSRGSVTLASDGNFVVSTESGKEVYPAGRNSYPEMISQFSRLVQGRPADEVQSTLELARGHLIAVNGASEATPVHTIPQQFIDIIPNDDGSTQTAIRGIESVFDECARSGRMLHESGLLKWTSKAGRRDLRGYNHFAGPALA